MKIYIIIYFILKLIRMKYYLMNIYIFNFYKYNHQYIFETILYLYFQGML